MLPTDKHAVPRGIWMPAQAQAARWEIDHRAPRGVKGVVSGHRLTQGTPIAAPKRLPLLAWHSLP